MKVLKIWGIRTASKVNKLFFLFIPIFGMLSIVMGVVSFYGMQTGDLSVRLNELADKNIRLDESRDFTQPRTILRYAGKKSYRDTSYAAVRSWYIPEILETDGRYERDYILAFSFYIMNTSEASTIDQIQYQIALSDVTQNIDDALRIMVIADEVQTVFEKVEDRLGDQTQPFISSTIAARGLILNIRAQQKVRVSVVIWLEGDLTNDDMIGGSMKLDMSFTIGEED